MELTTRQKRRAIIRWLWIPPCAILAWYVMLGLSAALNMLATLFCPADALVAGFCTASWFRTVEHVIMVSCAGLTALAIVVVSAITAPSYRTRAAMAVFVLCVLVAINMLTETGAYPAFIAAVVGGLSGVFVASCLKQSIEL